jgi:hypothetical protein
VKTLFFLLSFWCLMPKGEKIYVIYFYILDCIMRLCVLIFKNVILFMLMCCLYELMLCMIIMLIYCLPMYVCYVVIYLIFMDSAWKKEETPIYAKIGIVMPLLIFKILGTNSGGSFSIFDELSSFISKVKSYLCCHQSQKGKD